MNSFQSRHIGPREKDIKEMLKKLKIDSLEQLIHETIPDSILHMKPLKLGKAVSEFDYINSMRKIAKKNKVFKSYIGMGYSPTKLPAVILRNVLENPGWYTQYTPYQAEISQGRLEMLLNFQTMLSDLSGMPIANSSLLDEGTATAEAMTMAYRVRAKSKKKANTIFVSENCHPQTIDIVKTRASALKINVFVADESQISFDNDLYAMILSYPDTNGRISDFSQLTSQAKRNDVISIFVTDLMALAILKSPAECGADIVIGSTQRFGVPMGYGGPHAAFLATKEEYKRQVPGRIIGISVDANGDPAYRMALQTREQHIRRDKATSNICTAQALLANMAAMYVIYHGPEGIKEIATTIHKLTVNLVTNVNKLKLRLFSEDVFDTIRIFHPNLKKVKTLAEAKKINFRYFSDSIGISISEYTTIDDCREIHEILAESVEANLSFDKSTDRIKIPQSLRRESPYLQHPVFHQYHSETEMMRYLKRLENKDLSLTTSMIPLGSCTMKLNAATEMIPITWPEFSELHPFAPKEQAKAYHQIITKLEDMLKEITQFSAVSIQPNAGAQGEYSGLLVIKRYLEDKGEGNRNIVLIPASAHGTNPASAVMAGMKVLVTKTDENGNIDVGDLKEKAEKNQENLAALMVTYPSTHGVFEASIIEICEIIHKNGGQVYMDGANMNAQVGLTSPGFIGADVCHLNLHKTFAIPHGGGGPGMGPICVAKHLVPFLPSHPVISVHNGKQQIGTVSAAPWGSANILPISHAYIEMSGAEGLTKFTQVAILNANYIRERLSSHYSILFLGENGFVAHELIFDCREFKRSAGIDVGDIAKRLMDYGFHAPTVSFPVAGTLMVEPTESESKEELDRFCDTMIKIRQEIQTIEDGKADREDNLLINAPHTMKEIASDDWKHPYTRQEAAFPVEWLNGYKYWPAVARVDNTHGDRELICTCPPISDFE